MANHKRHRVKSRRAGCLMCKPHKDQRAKDTFAAQTLQERRHLLGERVDELALRPEDEDEPGVPRCAHCNGSVCAYEDCEDHVEDRELSDGKWACSEACRNALEPDFLDELVARSEATSPGFARRVDEAYARRISGRRGLSR